MLGAVGKSPVALDASIASGAMEGHELRVSVRGLLRSQLTNELLVSVAPDMPYLMEHIEQHASGMTDEPGFEIGLDQILDGLERRL